MDRHVRNERGIALAIAIFALVVVGALVAGVAYAAWMAAFTETVEKRNPAGTATGLAVWGAILRFVVPASLIGLLVAVPSAAVIVDHGPRTQAIVDRYPEQVATLKKRLVEFISTATGGDVPYHGGDMVSVHRGMNITDAEFDALAADLQAALKKNSVPAREQAELLAVVNRTRSAIVAAPGSAKAAETPKPAPAAVAERPAPFVPQPVTSDETELEEEPAAQPRPELNK